MSTPQTQKCHDEIVLQRLLSEQLQGDEEAAVLQHIETCEQCRNTLGSLAGAGRLESEMQQHLAGHSIDAPGAATVLEAEPGESDIEQIKALLGPTDDPHMLGRLGSYEISAIVGRGSAGIVFKALDKRLNRFVAIKMLAPAFAGSGPARKRFEREARSIAAVRDEHVVPVFAVDEHQGLPFIVMEYMPIGSLEQRIENEGALDTCAVTRIGMQIASALAAAHKQGIVHRDVKPANVLLSDGVDRALVTDFGLARILDEASMTRSGAISGTPQFMSPEQAAGEPVGHRSDLFSLGSVMYMACTGHSPFRSETVFGVIKRVCETEPRPIRETSPGVKRWLCDFITKLHAKDPSERFQSAQEVADLLAAELAYMQSPTTVPKPERQWRPRPTPAPSKGHLPSGKLLLGGLVATSAMLFGLFAWSGGFGQQENKSNTEPGSDASLAALSQDPQEGEDDHEVDDFDAAMKLHDAGEYVKAIQLFRKAAVAGNRVEDSTYNVACGYALLGQKKEALDALERALNLGFCDSGLCEKDSDLDSLRSEVRFKALMARVKDSAKLEAVLSKAKIAGRRDQFAEAEKLFLAVLKADPDNGQAAAELGYLLHRQGKLDEAFKWHTRAAASKTRAGTGNYNLACFYSLQNQPDKAFSYFEKSLVRGLLDDFDLYSIDHDSDLDAIRDDPRYEQIMQNTERRLQQGWSEKEKDCQRLIEAIKLNDAPGLQNLLRTIDPNCSCPDYRADRRFLNPPRRTPLGFAARTGNLPAARLLLGANARISYTAGGELTPLMTACKHGHLDVVKYLVANGAKIIRNLDGRGTAMTAAASGNHTDVMGFLLDMDADIDARVAGLGTPLVVAARNGHLESVRYLVAHNAAVDAKVDGVGTALAVSGRTGNAAVINFLLANDADINLPTPGVGTPLSVAIRERELESAKLLLTKGADINTRADGVGAPLTVAASLGDIATLQFLIENNAKIDQATPGVGTAIAVAARQGHRKAVSFLLSKGANPDATGPGVGTPLACAVRCGDRAIVQALLKAGADPELGSPGSKSALELARKKENKEMFQLLNGIDAQ